MKRIFLLIEFCAISVVSSAQYTKLMDFNCFMTGCNPEGSLLLPNNFSTLYGATISGGLGDWGMLFSINKDGSNYHIIRDFNQTFDGISPVGTPYMDFNYYLYQMTWGGTASTYTNGTIFREQPNSCCFSMLLTFTGGTDGAHPNGSLISDGSYLYGMTTSGGVNNFGTIFKIRTDGTGYVKLLDFAGTTNGRFPYGSLTLAFGDLYGMTEGGGVNDEGTIFRISTYGTNYLKLHDFGTSPDGYQPYGSLTFDGNKLYGMTAGGGANNRGVLFTISTNGSGYTKLIDFAGAANGRNPYGSLLYLNPYLYGMTSLGGVNDSGTVFRIKTDGSSFSKLYDFSGPADGSQPHGDLVADSTYLYGMTKNGGVNNGGVLFRYQYACTVPALQATNTTFTNVTSNSVKVNWTNGNGNRRIVKIKPTNTFTAPANGNDYTANAVYSGSGEQVVYNGTGNSVTVTGLSSASFYWFRIYEASCSSSNSLYLSSVATGNPRRVFTPAFNNPNRPEGEAAEAGDESIQAYPNPTSSSITLESSSNNLLDRVIVSGIDGRVIKSFVIAHSEKTTVDLKELSAGIYFLDCVGERSSQEIKVVKY